MLGKKVLRELEDIKDRLEVIISEDRIRLILENQINQLLAEKKDLMDRLMTKNWESFKTYTVEPSEEGVGRELRVEEDADMAGEVLEVKGN